MDRIANDSITIKIDPAQMKSIGAVFNPKKYSLKGLWESSLFRKQFSRYFKEMFQSGANGIWTISDKWKAAKKKRGYSTKANVMTGRTIKAMMALQDNADSIRIFEKQSLTWGVNIENFPDQYPQYPNAKNTFTFIDEIETNKLTEMIQDYLFKTMQGA